MAEKKKLRIPTRELRVQAKEKAGKLTTKGRRALSKKQFALPDGERPGQKGRYPIDTIERARNAISRVSRFGTPEEQRKVRAAVARKYPGIVQTKGQQAAKKKAKK